MKFAVFASGNGSNFEEIAKACQNGQISATLDFVFSDHRDAFVLERAKKYGIKAFTFELKEFDNKSAYEEEIVALCRLHEIDFIVLAGYMKIVSTTLLSAFEQKIINIHPAYLPEFPGAHGIEDAWNAKVSESGVTVHFVDSGIDTGTIIEQVRVPILKSDTLETFEERIHQAEYQLYPKVINDLSLDKI